MSLLCLILAPFAVLGLLCLAVIAHEEYQSKRFRKECQEEKKKQELEEPYNKNSPMVQRFQKLANINPHYNRYGRFDLRNMC